MKKSGLLLLFITCAITSAHAQFSFEGGLNMSNLNIESNGTKIPTKYVKGASFGMMGAIPLSDTRHVFLEIGALFQTDGATITTVPNWDYSLTSITFPISIEYKSGDKCSKRFFAGAGMYVRSNLSGSAYTLTRGGTTIEEYKDLSMGTDIKRVDMGLGLNVGYLGKKHWYIRGNFLQGLKDNLPTGNDKNHVKQSTAGLTLGYVFRGCKVHDWLRASKTHEPTHWRGIKKLRWSTKQRFRKPNGPAAY